MTQQEMDQALALFRDTLPRAWMACYQGCIAGGFSDSQAFLLLQTYILSQNPYGIRPGEGFGLKPNSEP